MQKRWAPYKINDQKKVEILSAELQIDKALARVLLNRGIDTFEKAKTFFTPSTNDLHNPFLMKDMDKAVQRITKALNNQEKILVYGDYDVDGTTAVSLVFDFLQNFTEDVTYYVPDRHKEGYGISDRGIQYASDHAFSLIIALDCGIKSIDKVEIATNLGIDFIICDHHNPGETIPAAVAVLDPKRRDCPYPFKELSGCGIGFKLVQAICQQKKLDTSYYFKYLDLTMVSVAADLVSIIDENRIFAWHGLKKLNTNACNGLKALVKVTNRPLPYTINDVLFQLAPRINAAGRMDHAKRAVEMLLCNDNQNGSVVSELINLHNTERKTSDQDITIEALAQLKADPDVENRKTTVVFKEHWNKGVIGIVASRLTETYYRPTVVLTESNGILTGSARSVPGFDLYEALEASADALIQFGGHKFAAGLTLYKENLNYFKELFEKTVAATILPLQLIPEIKIDASISLNQIDGKFHRILQRMEPFGPDNSAPIFSTQAVQLVGTPQILGEKHLKLWVAQNQSPLFECIAFGLVSELENLLCNKTFDIAYCIEEKNWKEKKSIQLNIKAIKHPENKTKDVFV